MASQSLIRQFIAVLVILLFSGQSALAQGNPEAITLPTNPGNGGSLTPLTSEDHVLRVGDELIFHIASLPETPSNYTIRVDGYFFHPVVGEVKASGRTLGDLRAELSKKLAKELRKPEFKLGIKTVAKHQVAVLGEANKQGTFEVGLGSTILDVIAQAGGLTEKSDRETAVLLRGEERLEVSLRPDAGGGLTQVRTGDVLYIQAGAPVSVTGEVTKPGVYAVSRTIGSPQQAILAAGGAKEEASLSRVRLIRASEPEPIILDLRADVEIPIPEKARQMQEGDILVVPGRQAVILGAVNKPGPVPLRGGESLLDVLPEHVTKDSDVNKIMVVRASDVAANRDKKEEYSLKNFFEKGDASAAVPIYDGDIVYVPAKPNSTGIFGTGGFNILSILSLARLFF